MDTATSTAATAQTTLTSAIESVNNQVGVVSAAQATVESKQGDVTTATTAVTIATATVSTATAAKTAADAVVASNTTPGLKVTVYSNPGTAASPAMGGTVVYTGTDTNGINEQWGSSGPTVNGGTTTVTETFANGTTSVISVTTGNGVSIGGNWSDSAGKTDVVSGPALVIINPSAPVVIDPNPTNTGTVTQVTMGVYAKNGDTTITTVNVEGATTTSTLDNNVVGSPSTNGYTSTETVTGTNIDTITIAPDQDYYIIDNVTVTKTTQTTVTEDFQVKWEGMWTPQYTGTQYITAPADDGVKLYLDGELVINDWVDKGGGGSTADVQTTAGVGKVFEMWYYENGGGANVALKRYTGSGWEIIPASEFSQTTASPEQLAAAQTATTALNTATTNLATAQSNLDAANTALTNAQTDLSTSQTTLTELQTAQTNAQVALATANSNLTDATNLLTNLIVAQTTAQTEVNTAQSALDAATSELQVKTTVASLLLQTAQSAANTAVTAAIEAQTAVSNTPIQAPQPVPVVIVTPSPQPESYTPSGPTDAPAPQPEPSTPEVSPTDGTTSPDTAPESNPSGSQGETSTPEDTTPPPTQPSDDGQGSGETTNPQDSSSQTSTEGSTSQEENQTPSESPSDTSSTETQENATSPESTTQQESVPQNTSTSTDPNQLPDTTPKLPSAADLVPHVQVDKAGVANGGIEFFGTKSQPQVVGEDGKLTPPPPPPGSGLPIPPDAITIEATFIGQPGGTTFNSPDVATPLELTYVCTTVTKEDGSEVHIDSDGIEHSIEHCTFLPAALDVIPGAGEAIQAIGALYTDLANIGNDMSPTTRKKAKKILVATLVVAAVRRRFN